MVPYSDDGLLHLFRTFAIDRTIHAGVLYPRWLPDLGYGYGYPIFDFYPPLASYIVETIHLLGAGFALATNVTFIGIVALTILALAAALTLSGCAPKSPVWRRRRPTPASSW